jgi:hypothetical protein
MATTLLEENIDNRPLRGQCAEQLGMAAGYGCNTAITHVTPVSSTLMYAMQVAAAVVHMAMVHARLSCKNDTSSGHQGAHLLARR